MASKGGHPASHDKKLLCYKQSIFQYINRQIYSSSPISRLGTSLTAPQISSDWNFTRALYPQNFTDSYGMSPSAIMISLKRLEVPGDENAAPNRWNNDDIKPTGKARQKWTFWTFHNFCSSDILMTLNSSNHRFLLL